MNHKDELIQDFGSEGLGTSADPNINNTVGARQATGENTAPFRGPISEYKQPESRLPMSISQSEIASKARTYTNIGPGGSDAPSLAGTKVQESDNA